MGLNDPKPLNLSQPAVGGAWPPNRPAGGVQQPAKPGIGQTIQNGINTFNSGLNTVNQGFGALNNLGSTISNGFASALNPFTAAIGGVSSIVSAANQAWDLGGKLVGGFKSIFGLDKADKEAAAKKEAEERQRIVDDRNQMIGEETSDQERRARAQQYSQTHAYGTVDWEYGPDGTPHQISRLDDYQQSKKDAAGNMIGQIAGQDAVNNAVNSVVDSQMEMYHRHAR